MRYFPYTPSEVINRFVSEARMDRQADIPFVHFFCKRAFTGLVAQIAIGCTQMYGRIVRPDFDMPLCIHLPHEVLFAKRETILQANTIDMEHVFYVRTRDWEPQSFDTRQSMAVVLSN
jgi:hypothetical protein